MFSKIAFALGALALVGVGYLYYFRPIVQNEPVDPCQEWETYVASSEPLGQEAEHYALLIVHPETSTSDFRRMLVRLNEIADELQDVSPETGFIRTFHETNIRFVEAQIDRLILLVDDDPTNDASMSEQVDQATRSWFEGILRANSMCGAPKEASRG